MRGADMIKDISMMDLIGANLISAHLVWLGIQALEERNMRRTPSETQMLRKLLTTWDGYGVSVQMAAASTVADLRRGYLE